MNYLVINKETGTKVSYQKMLVFEKLLAAHGPKRKSKNDGGSHSLSFIQICLPCAAAHFQISGTLCRRRPSRPGWRRIGPGVHSQC